MSNRSHYVEPAEMARQLGVSRSTVLRLIRRENLPHMRVGRAIRVDRDLWRKFLETNGGRPAKRSSSFLEKSGFRPPKPTAQVQENLFPGDQVGQEVRIVLEIEVVIRPLVLRP